MKNKILETISIQLVFEIVIRPILEHFIKPYVVFVISVVKAYLENFF